RGAGVAAGGAMVLLAYPLWFLLRGPAHLSGPIWSNGGTLAHYGNTLTSFWTTGGLEKVHGLSLRFGGYQGPVLPGLGYLGVGIIVVALVGVVIWRHDRCLLLFGGVGIVAGVFSLGPGHGVWVPWQAIAKVPWIGDIVEVRFTFVLTLCAAVMVAIVIDRIHTWASGRRPASAINRWLAVALAAVMFVPTLAAVWSNVPITTRAVVLPRWYTEVGAHLPAGTVVLAYPTPFSGLQSSQAWQAVNSMRWAQAGGGGPEGQSGRAGRARPGFGVLFDASLALGVAPGPTSANLTAIRQALIVWGVTTIVVPVQADLPLYEQGRSSAYAVGLLTAAMGRPPTFSHSAWVWSSVETTGAPVAMASAAFDACTTGPVASDPTPRAVPTCVLASRR
ncbi:MAG TPA: hypothetical protein VF279_05025, partial [Acidimicrobiales bacterium]